MLYKTIVLELLQETTELYEQLKVQRQLLPTLETCSAELKAAHNRWKKMLKAVCPDSQEQHIASEALEVAIAELRARLPQARLPDSLLQDETFSLDEAMAFVASHTPSA